MLVRYTKINVSRVFTKNGEATLFIPGMNEVQTSTWNELLANPHFKEDFEEGHYEVITEKEPEPGESQLAIFPNVRKAFEIIKETYDAKLLLKWRSKDDRKTIVEAIDEQLARIEKRKEGKKTMEKATSKRRKADDDDED